MLDINDYRVAVIKNDVESDGKPAKDFYNASDLNNYFGNMEKEERKKFKSVGFNGIREFSGDMFSDFYALDKNNYKSIIDDAMKLLQQLRNDEMHFYIDKKDFLTDKEFKQLYNFMIIFYKLLNFYDLLPFWGESGKEFEKISFNNKEMKNFSYKDVLKNSPFVRELAENVKKEIFFLCGSSSYEIAESIVCVLSDEYDWRFSELWTYIDMLLDYELLTYEKLIGENELEEEQIIYSQDLYRIDINI